MKPSDDRLERIRAGAARHLAEYVASDGGDVYMYKGAPTLILTARGRKSGEPRSTPLIFGRDGASFIVVASLGGSDDHPGWYRNLLAYPDAEVQVKDERTSVRASTAADDERERLWAIMVGVYPAYGEYQRRTDRQLPVVVLDPR